MDINALDFMDNFKLENATVGIVGQGFVGGAMREYFKDKVRVLAHDKYKTGFLSLDDVTKQSDVIFVCVPTPMRHTGECYTGIVEEALQAVFDSAKQFRPLDTFVVVIKSTVPPGFTISMQQKFPGARICFSPEYLTERNAVNDMKEANRIVIGGSVNDASVVLRYFLAVDERRVDEGKCVLIHAHPTVAEMSKLYTNGILFTKVLFSNEIALMCDAIGIPYDEVRLISCLDPRIGSSHTIVPGPDGLRGAGGHCFPKDMHSLVFEAEKLGVKQKLFSAVLDRNSEVREEKDWEKMKERAVTER